jgi:hypothetical protein
MQRKPPLNGVLITRLNALYQRREEVERQIQILESQRANAPALPAVFTAIPDAATTPKARAGVT